MANKTFSFPVYRHKRMKATGQFSKQHLTGYRQNHLNTAAKHIPLRLICNFKQGIILPNFYPLLKMP